MRDIIYKSIKISLGVVISIIIAEFSNLEFALSAGVITLLTMLDMKRQSLIIAAKRIYTGILALVLGSIVFSIFNFSPFSLGLFLMIYIPILLKFNATVGLVVNTVLITHIYSFKEITIGGLVNEALLMLIGIVIALIVNLHMPNFENEVRKIIRKTEEQMKGFLYSMSANLKNECEITGQYVTLMDLKNVLEEGKLKATEHMNRYYFKGDSYFVEYFEMRFMQYYRLKYMQDHFKTVFITQKEANLLSDFTSKLADVIHEYNTGETLLLELEALRAYFRTTELPKTREEFENRAVLYQYLNDLEEFISIKSRFMKEHNEQK